MGYTPAQLEVRSITGGYKIFPPTNTTTDDLIIYPNGTDIYPQITFFGDAYLGIYGKSTNILALYNATVEVIRLLYSGTDATVESKVANSNLYLKTNGTGNVKFGTYTGGAATDSTGYITILDAAGNTRKLMVQA